MDKHNLDFIKQLTLQDKKTLSQKALKTTEEVGELAKVVLPFDSAHATNHRFIKKEKILEEAVDVILTALSIAYDLGYDDDQINDMVNEKCLKWGELQAREEKVLGKIPYEIHVTVNTDKLDDFKSVCEKLNVKPIILDLQNRQGNSVMTDVMTSSVFMGSNSQAYIEMKRISDGLVDHNFQVVREKIETVPWHPAAPSNSHKEPIMPANCYFETHFNIIANSYRLNELKKIAENNKAHLSRNIFKTLQDGDFKIMMTYRVYSGTYEDFKDEAESIKFELEDASFKIDKMITEFSVYDTKISHDSSWLKSS